MSDFQDPTATEKPARNPRKVIKREGAVTNDSEVRRADKAHANRKRPERVPMGALRAYVDYPEHLKDPDFFYYFVADVGGNIELRKAAGYDFVYNEDGSKYIRTGKDGVDMVLMRQPMEYRNEDLLLKREQSSAIVRAEQKLQPGEYLPEGRTSKMQKDSDFIDPMLPG